MTLDQRHLDATTLAAMYKDARDASERIAAEEKIGVEWKKLWQIQPFPFHPALIDMADESIKEICGVSYRLPSGPLHDAAEICRTGVPTVMLFVQSLHGISHNKIEDTKEEHIQMSVRALDRLADKTIQWIVGGTAGGSRKAS
jgi:N-carbamoyl-L-amino-acid hydrolase